MKVKPHNISQLIDVVDKSIEHYEDFLAGEIRAIGLREKIGVRLKTLRRIEKVLLEHSDTKPERQP